uniref:G-protein coupled receptors family 1 profile domain-containing protein n=1 Tax=Sus scrofa TaxID=9823 RepID=A0A8D1CT83_PIG
MEAGNHTGVSKLFLLLGLSEDPELQPLLFGLFLSIYLVTVSDSRLHTPMYFFLSNLSFVDICFVSTTVPKMLVNIEAQSKDISYIGCLTQVYFFMVFAGMDDFLLTVMLTFCVGTEIPHFFCELAQILKVACSDTFINEVCLYVATALLCMLPLTGVLFSYSQTVSTLMKMASTEGKYKAFSTCGSHLSVVTLFYGTSLGVYFTSAVTHSPHRISIASVMYTVVTPMLNPFIYSLRNKDVKGALGRWWAPKANDAKFNILFLFSPQNLLDFFL